MDRKLVTEIGEIMSNSSKELANKLTSLPNSTKKSVMLMLFGLLNGVFLSLLFVASMKDDDGYKIAKLGHGLRERTKDFMGAVDSMRENKSFREATGVEIHDIDQNGNITNNSNSEIDNDIDDLLKRISDN